MSKFAHDPEKLQQHEEEMIRKFEDQLEMRRSAERYITNFYEEEDVDDELGIPLELFDVIWHASTVILPKLEVQVIIDSNDKIFVSTGTAGYVDFKIDPVGMKLPIKCWIHTHPFGRAYFSGTDISTVSIWEPLMKEAYVLGGEGHYGYWSQEAPTKLEIFHNNLYEETQVWNRKGDEEE
tara:strand:- start:2224 stop:2763 length:540 start_codon:yes stop_codon:yes gene_type:complete